MKYNFDTALQTQNMSHDVKMAKLNNDYLTAQKTGDVNRQKQILDFTYKQDLIKMEKEQGYEESKLAMQANVQYALQQGDHEHAAAMQRALFNQQTTEAAKDRALEEAGLALQQKGVDMKEIESNYTILENQVKAGLLDPKVLTEYLDKTISTNGVKLEAPDPKAAQIAADKEWEGMQTEYGKTHPEFVAEDGRTLTTDGQKAFSVWYNENQYGEQRATSEAAISEKAKEAINDPAKYDALMKDPSVKEWTPKIAYDDRGMWQTDERYIQNAPAKGSIFKYNGKAYEVISDKTMNAKGQNSDEFQVKDLATNTTKTVKVAGTAKTKGAWDYGVGGILGMALSAADKEKQGDLRLIGLD